ncbi:MAG: cobalamin-dependent protein [Paracoccaceae bacterium]
MDDGEFEVFDLEKLRRSDADLSRLAARVSQDLPGGLAHEVVTRLNARARAVPPPVALPDVDDIEELCIALLAEDQSVAVGMISKLDASGLSKELIYLNYFAAAARMLGQWWEENTLSFAEVTMGTSRLYALMRSLNVPTDALPQDARKKAAFAAVPGEIHTLGVKMAADLFRDRGWEISLRVGLSHDELVASMEALSPRVIGLSAGGKHSSAALARLIVALRISVPRALILVSGKIVQRDEDLIGLLGVDAAADDMETACSEIERLAEIAYGPASARDLSR